MEVQQCELDRHQRPKTLLKALNRERPVALAAVAQGEDCRRECRAVRSELDTTETTGLGSTDVFGCLSTTYQQQLHS